MPLLTRVNADAKAVYTDAFIIEGECSFPQWLYDSLQFVDRCDHK